MAIEIINTTDIQENETNVNWVEDGEFANDVVLNRPIKQVAEIVNDVIGQVNENTSDIANLTLSLLSKNYFMGQN